jgi:uncharacterized protein YoxC
MTKDAALKRKLESISRLTKAASELLTATNSILDRADALLEDIEREQIDRLLPPLPPDARVH